MCAPHVHTPKGAHPSHPPPPSWRGPMRRAPIALDQLVADHLDQVLHELVGRNWLATVPPHAPPCLAARFQLRQDPDPDPDPDVDMDGNGQLRITHLAAGATWMVGGSGSDGRG